MKGFIKVTGDIYTTPEAIREIFGVNLEEITQKDFTGIYQKCDEENWVNWKEFFKRRENELLK